MTGLINDASGTGGSVVKTPVVANLNATADKGASLVNCIVPANAGTPGNSSCTYADVCCPAGRIFIAGLRIAAPLEFSNCSVAVAVVEFEFANATPVWNPP